jgi:hypothetical protein
MEVEMSGSVARPRFFRESHGVVWQQFRASKDALDLAEDIRRLAYDALKAGDMLLAFPADAEERIKARNIARKMIEACDDLERLS